MILVDICIRVLYFLLATKDPMLTFCPALRTILSFGHSFCEKDKC